MTGDTVDETRHAEGLRLGYVGLGSLGAPMAMRLADWPGGLVVYDIRDDASAALAQAGVRVADNLAEVAAADLISVTVLDDAQVREVVADLAEHAAIGTVVAVHSTISDVTAVALADQLIGRGIHVIDAPVSGGAGAAASGELATMVGAPRGVYNLVMPVFRRWASLVIHAGPPGAGTRMKLARNMLTFSGFAAAGEAMRLAQAAGLDLQSLGRVVRHTDALTGGPGAIMIRDTLDEIEPGHWLYDTFSHTCRLAEKDLDLALELGDSLGVPLPLAILARRELAAGLGVSHRLEP